jgi:hypothetical protein
MSAHSTTIALDHVRDAREHTGRLVGGDLVARLRNGLLRRLREAAWHALDLHTEFEPLD